MPLHIFEPRYRQLVKDTLDTGDPFGIVLTRRTRQSATTEDREPTHEIGCTVRMETNEAFPDGRFNIGCIGERRFRIIEKLGERPYWVANVEYLDDPPDAESTEAYTAYDRRRLPLPGPPGAGIGAAELLAADLSPAATTESAGQSRRFEHRGAGLGQTGSVEVGIDGRAAQSAQSDSARLKPAAQRPGASTSQAALRGSGRRALSRKATSVRCARISTSSATLSMSAATNFGIKKLDSLVGVAVQVVRAAPQLPHSVVSGQFPDVVQDKGEITVLFVPPAIGSRNRLGHVGSRASTLLRCLMQIARCQIAARSPQELLRLVCEVLHFRPIRRGHVYFPSAPVLGLATGRINPVLPDVACDRQAQQLSRTFSDPQRTAGAVETLERVTAEQGLGSVELDGSVNRAMETLGGEPLGGRDLGAGGGFVGFSGFGGSIKGCPSGERIGGHVGEDCLDLLLLGQRLSAAVRTLDPL